MQVVDQNGSLRVAVDVPQYPNRQFLIRLIRLQREFDGSRKRGTQAGSNRCQRVRERARKRHQRAMLGQQPQFERCSRMRVEILTDSGRFAETFRRANERGRTLKRLLEARSQPSPA